LHGCRLLSLLGASFCRERRKKTVNTGVEGNQHEGGKEENKLKAIGWRPKGEKREMGKKAQSIYRPH
jgi:hypothetical protein